MAFLGVRTVRRVGRVGAVVLLRPVGRLGGLDRVCRINAVDRVCRLDPVDRFERFDPVDRCRRRDPQPWRCRWRTACPADPWRLPRGRRAAGSCGPPVPPPVEAEPLTWFGRELVRRKFRDQLSPKLRTASRAVSRGIPRLAPTGHRASRGRRHCRRALSVPGHPGVRVARHPTGRTIDVGPVAPPLENPQAPS